MKSILLTSVAALIGAFLFTSCAAKQTTSTTDTTASTSGKDAVTTRQAPMARDTGPRQ